MPYIEPEIVKEVAQIDLKKYLQICKPQELVKIAPGCYCTRTHDSLKISNGKWMWWSKGIGGFNAIDYLTKVEKMSFYNAVNKIIEDMEIDVKSKRTYKKAKKLVMPPKAENNQQVISYLKNRGISENVIQECIDRNILYEEKRYHYVVFLGYKGDEPKYACLRSTRGKKFYQEPTGSDKRYTFKTVTYSNESVHIFESCIDMLSYATLFEMCGNDWKEYDLLALSGVYSTKQFMSAKSVPISMIDYMKKNKKLKRIYFHFDNDAAGRNAAKQLSSLLCKKYQIINAPAPIGKDINEYLCYKIKCMERNDLNGI